MCTKTCGGGTHQRTRSIDVEVANGGTNCTGDAVESGVCNTNNCPGGCLPIIQSILNELICDKFQSPALGQHGDLGAHVQRRVTQAA